MSRRVSEPIYPLHPHPIFPGVYTEEGVRRLWRNDTGEWTRTHPSWERRQQREIVYLDTSLLPRDDDRLLVHQLRHHVANEGHDSDGPFERLVLTNAVKELRGGKHGHLKKLMHLWRTGLVCRTGVRHYTGGRYTRQLWYLSPKPGRKGHGQERGVGY